MTALITWYRQPMDQLTGHFINNLYDFEVAPRMGCAARRSEALLFEWR
jgi:hypothetical protein